jgi:hypothetical protein
MESEIENLRTAVGRLNELVAAIQVTELPDGIDAYGGRTAKVGTRARVVK